MVAHQFDLAEPLSRIPGQHQAYLRQHRALLWFVNLEPLAVTDILTRVSSTYDYASFTFPIFGVLVVY
jgi:hypothetical protein